MTMCTIPAPAPDSKSRIRMGTGPRGLRPKLKHPATGASTPLMTMFNTLLNPKPADSFCRLPQNLQHPTQTPVAVFCSRHFTTSPPIYFRGTAPLHSTHPIPSSRNSLRAMSSSRSARTPMTPGESGELPGWDTPFLPCLFLDVLLTTGLTFVHKSLTNRRRPVKAQSHLLRHQIPRSLESRPYKVGRWPWMEAMDGWTWSFLLRGTA